METSPKPRASRRFKIVLGLSLALNLLFVGLIAGAVWRNQGGPGPRFAGPGLQSYAAPYVHALPRAERRALNRSIRAAHPRLGREARRAVYGEMLTALRATPFDVAAVQEVLDGQRRAILGVQEAAQSKWMAAISAMSDAERQAYADRLQELIEKRRHNRGKRRQNSD